MLQVVIRKAGSKFFYLFFVLSAPLYAGFLQDSAILDHNAYDIAFALPFTEHSKDMGAVSPSSGGFGVRSGLGFYNFMDLNFSLAKWDNFKPVAAVEMRLGLPKDYSFRPSVSFGVGYAKFEANVYTNGGYTNNGTGFNYQTAVVTDNLQFPINIMFSERIDLGFLYLEPYAGLNILMNKYKSLSFRGPEVQTDITKDTFEYFYFGKAGIIISPACFKITKFVFETYQSLTNRTRIVLGDTYVVGIIIHIKALGNTDYLSF